MEKEGGEGWWNEKAEEANDDEGETDDEDEGGSEGATEGALTVCVKLLRKRLFVGRRPRLPYKWAALRNQVILARVGRVRRTNAAGDAHRRLHEVHRHVEYRNALHSSHLSCRKMHSE